MLTPARANEDLTKPLILYPGWLLDYFPHFDVRQYQAVSVFISGQKQETQTHPKNPRGKEQKTHTHKPCPLNLHICITV